MTTPQSVSTVSPASPGSPTSPLSTAPSAATLQASQRERDGQWLLIAGGVLLGTIGVFVEEAGQHPLVTVWFRCAFGALALLAWCLATGRGRELLLVPRPQPDAEGDTLPSGANAMRAGHRLATGGWASNATQRCDAKALVRARWVACATGVLMVLNWALFFAAIPRTSIAVATVIFHIQPIWVIVFGALF